MREIGAMSVPFEDDPSCPACGAGSGLVNVRDCTKQHSEGPRGRINSTPSGTGGVEHLDRVCTKCGFNWMMELKPIKTA
jgi:ribosomal protein S27AE